MELQWIAVHGAPPDSGISKSSFNGEFMNENSQKLNGIGGWLVLVIIGMIVTPIRTGYFLFSTYLPLFTDGILAAITTPGTKVYHALWAPLLIFEIVGNLGIITLSVLTLWHLFRKSRLTPRLGIAWLSWSLFFVVVDFFAANLIPVIAAQNDPDSAREVTRTVIAAAIWIPYFLVSKRVKATFVR